MLNNALKTIFEFLEEKEGQNPPLLWKHKNNIPLTEEDLNIEGNLDLGAAEITSLPKGLKVGGDLNLTESDIETLPEGLEVGGSLYLDHSLIKSLPKGLKVGVYLNL